MSALIAGMWSRFAGYIAALGALLALIVSAFLKGKSDQKQKAKLDDVTAANQIRKTGADARASAAAGRLRDSDGWKRD